MEDAALLLLPVTAGIDVLGARLLGQREQDRRHKSYKLSFPRELDEERVKEWLRSFSGTLRSRSKLDGFPTVVLETWADHQAITHRLKIPWQTEDIILPQLRLAGIRHDEDKPPKVQWKQAVELRLKHNHRPLYIDSVPAMSIRLLKTFEGLREGERLLFQIVLAPAASGHPPVHGDAHSLEFRFHHLFNGALANHDEINDRRSKLEEPNFHAVIRVAAVARKDSRAKHLLHRIHTALSSTENKHTYFERRFVPKKDLQERIDRSAGSLFFPVRLSVPARPKHR